MNEKTQEISDFKISCIDSKVVFIKTMNDHRQILEIRKLYPECHRLYWINKGISIDNQGLYNLKTPIFINLN